MRELLGLPGNNYTCGILMAESAVPEVGVGNSKWETSVWESFSEVIGLGILSSAPGWFL